MKGSLLKYGQKTTKKPFWCLLLLYIENMTNEKKDYVVHTYVLHLSMVFQDTRKIAKKMYTMIWFENKLKTVIICNVAGMIWFEKYFLLYTQHGKKSQKINVGEFNLAQKSTRKEKRNVKGTGLKKLLSKDFQKDLKLVM